MEEELKGYIKPRPIRIAFLVGDCEHRDLVLDGIFADCFKRWGGRFSLVVPLVEGVITKSYWSWLETFDPDLVYSYSTLKATLVQSLQEELNPSEVIVHRHQSPPRLDVHGFKPRYDFEPLQSLSTLFHQHRYVRTANNASLSIIDSWGTEETSRFITDNFGTYRSSYGTSMWPADASPKASLKTIVSPIYSNSRKYGVPQNLDKVDSEIEAFRGFAKRQLSSLSISSAIYAPKLEIRDNNWSSSFNLVIGSTAEDRILHWNARLLIPAWLGKDICCLRVDPGMLGDEIFLGVLSEFLKNHNHVNAGSGGTSQLKISSASVPLEQLEEAKGYIDQHGHWSFSFCQKIDHLDELVPSERALSQARMGHRFGAGFSRGPDTEAFGYQTPVAKPPSLAPHFLDDAPPRQSFVQGFWATDCELQLPTLGENNLERWHFLKRWQMATVPTFNRSQTSSQQYFPAPRANSLGQLTYFTSPDAIVDGISIPTGSEAIKSSLQSSYAIIEEDVHEGRVAATAIHRFMEPSNEARYLSGILGMFGGLDSAAEYLLHPFLLEILQGLGGTPSIAKSRIKSVSQTLPKKDDQYSLTDKQDREALAKLVIKTAKGLKTPRRFVTYIDLSRKWDCYRNAYWTKHEKPNQDPSDTFDYDESDRKTLEDCLISLREMEALFQGQEFTCRKCFHRNWVNIDELRPRLTCAVCKQVRPAPINETWMFRANDFLIQTLRDRSVLSLIATLLTLKRRCRSSFYYTGPTAFYEDYESFDQRKAKYEIDLIVVSDGQALICEVKSSWSSVSTKDINALVAQAKTLRPHRAVLAVMEVGMRFKAEIQKAKEELAPMGIELEIIELSTGQMRSYPTLPYSESALLA